MRVDVCYENFNFHHQFRKLNMRAHQKWMFVKVDVHKKHEAFIAIYKIVSLGRRS